MLIVFDGIDGVGKTTQLKLVQEELEKQGLDVEVRRHLGGTPIGEALREAMLQPISRPPETDLYISVAILEALIEEVDKLRQAGKVILLDRGPISLAAYQAFGSNLSEALVWPYVDKGMKSLKPDLTIIYGADIARSLERAKSHSAKADYFESKPLTYFEKVVQGYEAGAKRYPGVVNIDANRPIKGIHDDTMRAIQGL